jgi:hypothetical protein
VESGEQGLGEGGGADELVDALGHFLGSLVGKGDGEDGVGRDVAFFNEVRDAMGDDAGFAGAGTGEQQNGAVHGFNAGGLLGVHVL